MKTDGKYLRLISENERVCEFSSRFLGISLWYNNRIKEYGSLDPRTFVNALSIKFSTSIHDMDCPKKKLESFSVYDQKAVETVCRNVFENRPSYRERWSVYYSSLFYHHAHVKPVHKGLKLLHYEISLSIPIPDDKGSLSNPRVTYLVNEEDHAKFFVHKEPPPVLDENEKITVWKTLLVLENLLRMG